MIKPWNATLNETGRQVPPIQMPNGTTDLDRMVEDNALEGKALTGLNAPTIYKNVIAGTGDLVAVVSNQGFYAGNQFFQNAPFSVDLFGALIATSATISGNITTDSLTIGSPSGQGLFLGTFNLLGDDETGMLFRDESGNPAGELIASNAVGLYWGNATPGDLFVGSWITIGLISPGIDNIVLQGQTGLVLDSLDGDIVMAPAGTDSSTNPVLHAYAGGSIQLASDPSQGVGFYGTAPTSQYAIFGSQGGNAALASLITALAGMGIVQDNTTP